MIHIGVPRFPDFLCTQNLNFTILVVYTAFIIKFYIEVKKIDSAVFIPVQYSRIGNASS